MPLPVTCVILTFKCCPVRTTDKEHGYGAQLSCYALTITVSSACCLAVRKIDNLLGVVIRRCQTRKRSNHLWKFTSRLRYVAVLRYVVISRRSSVGNRSLCMHNGFGINNPGVSFEIGSQVLIVALRKAADRTKIFVLRSI